MRKIAVKSVVALVVGLSLALWAGGPAAAQTETPQSGGILNFVVGSKIPSYDGHMELSLIHISEPTRPY